MLIEASETLREWLTIEMAPICDADPAALAKYVMALLKKDKSESELKDFCIEQLEVFLQKETKTFVDKLFSAVNTKSYLQQSTPSMPMSMPKVDSTKTEIEAPIPAKSSGSGTWKPLEDKGSGERRRKSSPVIAVPGTRDEQRQRHRRSRSRSPRGDRRRPIPIPPSRTTTTRQGERRNVRQKRSRSRSPHEINRPERKEKTEENVDKKKRRCRDYDEKGYCMRGDLCQFDHGPDPVVVDDSALEKMVNISGKPGALPNFSVPPPGYTPVNPPPPGVDNAYMANAIAPIVEGYNPEAPSLSGDVGGLRPPDFSIPPPPLPGSITRAPWASTNYSVPPASSMMHPQSMDGRRGGGLMGRLGPSRFPSPPQGKTLQVRKVPTHLNSIAKLNEHFGQFGQITNIQVRYGGDPEGALITYSSRHEAVAAYKSTAPILNNRFIKVFWHGGENLAGIKDRLGSGVDESAIPAISNSDPNQQRPGAVTFQHGTLTKTVRIDQPQPSIASNGATSHPFGLPSLKRSMGSQPVNEDEAYVQARKKRKHDKERRLHLLEDQKRKGELYAKRTEEQKAVLLRIQKCQEPVVKKELFKLFKTLDESAKKLKLDMEENAKMMQTMNVEKKVEAVQNEPKTKEELEKETLDLELELMNAGQGAAMIGLQRRLADLKRQLCTTGQPMTSTPLQQETQPRQRAVPEIASLDKRSRNLLVQGFQTSDEQQLVLHMQRFGQLDDIDVDQDRNGRPRALFTYKRRKDAEQALELAADFDGGDLQIQWAASRRESQSDVVPDEERAVEHRVTPAALLASIGTIESDEDETENAPPMAS